MLNLKWTGFSCNSNNFVEVPVELYTDKTTNLNYLVERRKFLQECERKYPLIHLWGDSDGSNCDPLIDNMNKYLNTFKGIQTVYSCQGGYNQSPYVGFYADAEDMISLQNQLQDITRGDHFWNNFIITYHCRRDISSDWKNKSGIEKDIWMIQFYDTLSVMWLLLKVGITIEQQLVLPEQFKQDETIKEELNIFKQGVYKFINYKNYETVC